MREICGGEQSAYLFLGERLHLIAAGDGWRQAINGGDVESASLNQVGKDRKMPQLRVGKMGTTGFEPVSSWVLMMGGEGFEPPTPAV